MDSVQFYIELKNSRRFTTLLCASTWCFLALSFSDPSTRPAWAPSCLLPYSVALPLQVFPLDLTIVGIMRIIISLLTDTTLDYRMVSLNARPPAAPTQFVARRLFAQENSMNPRWFVTWHRCVVAQASFNHPRWCGAHTDGLWFVLTLGCRAQPPPNHIITICFATPPCMWICNIWINSWSMICPHAWL